MGDAPTIVERDGQKSVPWFNGGEPPKCPNPECREVWQPEHRYFDEATGWRAEARGRIKVIGCDPDKLIELKCEGCGKQWQVGPGVAAPAPAKPAKGKKETARG